MKPQRLNIESEAHNDPEREVVNKIQDGMYLTVAGAVSYNRFDDDMVLEPNVNMKIGSGESLKCGTKKAIMKQGDDGRPMIASAQIGMDELVDEGERA